MRKALLAVVCLASLSGPAAMAQTPPAPQTPQTPGVNCFDARLRNSTGMTLALDNGQRFRVVPGAGRTTVTTWLPRDRLEVCRVAGSKFSMTNLSRPRPTTIQAVRQFNATT
jgi:hypothetical protein